MLYLDCEFNGHEGELISLALVSDHDDVEFYEVLQLPEVVHPWVREHVVPLLNKPAVDHGEFRQKLWSFLRRGSRQDIVADWTQDFVHLLEEITMPDGVRLNVDFNMRLVSDLDCRPAVPHNALSDARALRLAYLLKDNKRVSGRTHWQMKALPPRALFIVQAHAVESYRSMARHIGRPDLRVYGDSILEGRNCHRLAGSELSAVDVDHEVAMSEVRKDALRYLRSLVRSYAPRSNTPSFQS